MSVERFMKKCLTTFFLSQNLATPWTDEFFLWRALSRQRKRFLSLRTLRALRETKSVWGPEQIEQFLLCAQ